MMFAVGAVWYFIQKHFHPESTDPASLPAFADLLRGFPGDRFIASSIAFALERRQPEAREDAWLLSQVWLQRFAYRQVFSLVLFRTLKRAIRAPLRLGQTRPHRRRKLRSCSAIRRLRLGEPLAKGSNRATRSLRSPPLPYDFRLRFPPTLASLCYVSY
jgi:hypothetical protein